MIWSKDQPEQPALRLQLSSSTFKKQLKQDYLISLVKICLM